MANFEEELARISQEVVSHTGQIATIEQRVYGCAQGAAALVSQQVKEILNGRGVLSQGSLGVSTLLRQRIPLNYETLRATVDNSSIAGKGKDLALEILRGWHKTYENEDKIVLYYAYAYKIKGEYTEAQMTFHTRPGSTDERFNLALHPARLHGDDPIAEGYFDVEFIAEKGMSPLFRELSEKFRQLDQFEQVMCIAAFVYGVSQALPAKIFVAPLTSFLEL